MSTIFAYIVPLMYGGLPYCCLTYPTITIVNVYHYCCLTYTTNVYHYRDGLSGL